MKERKKKMVKCPHCGSTAQVKFSCEPRLSYATDMKTLILVPKYNIVPQFLSYHFLIISYQHIPNKNITCFEKNVREMIEESSWDNPTYYAIIKGDTEKYPYQRR